jgi:hypothetical protein
MSINSPRIAAGSTVQRGEIRQQPIYSGDVAAGGTTVAIVEGRRTEIEVLPEFEGQLYAQIVGQGSGAYATLWVAADVGGTLSWFNIPMGHGVNPDTGKPYLKSAF